LTKRRQLPVLSWWAEAHHDEEAFAAPNAIVRTAGVLLIGLRTALTGFVCWPVGRDIAGIRDWVIWVGAVVAGICFFKDPYIVLENIVSVRRG
jgi:hypothetical protein